MAMTILNEQKKVVWEEGDGITPEIEYLIREKKFEIFWKRGEKQFQVLTPRGIKAFPIKTKILFYDIVTTADGEVESLKYRVKPVVYWKGEKGTEVPEIAFLLKHGLIIDPDNFESMYRYKDENGSWHSYPSGSEFKFFNINMDKIGNIQSLNFHVMVNQFKTVDLTSENEETQFLIRKNNLIIDPDNDKERYRLKTNTGWKTYPVNSRAQFWSYVYDECGRVISANFKIQVLRWT